MCRLAAFPPNFPRNEALEILSQFECGNTDGTGYAYVADGHVKLAKWPKPFSRLIARGVPLLPHMPYNGWTIAHLRAASHGGNTYNNTHPFTIGKWVMCHNGIWHDHNIARLALSKYVKFSGETDSEVACNVINDIGPKQFVKQVEGAGVFLALKRNGELWIMNTSGDLVLSRTDNRKYLIASSLDAFQYKQQYDMNRGWYHFDRRGKLISSQQIKPYYMRRGFQGHVFRNPITHDEIIVNSPGGCYSMWQ
jgi:predicted glutamine amidotransferase